MSTRMRKWLMLIVGVVITVVSLWYSTRTVNFHDMLESLRIYHYVWLVPALIVFFISMYSRAIRWGLLFAPRHRLRGYDVFAPLMICFAFNSIMPARVGEFVRAFMVGSRKGIGIPAAVATVIAERILDAATLLTLLAISLSVLPPMPADLVYYFGNTKLDAAKFTSLFHGLVLFCIVLVAGVVLFMIPAVQLLVARIVRGLPFIPHAIRLKLEQMVMQFAHGFHALREPLIFAQIMFHSVLLWVLVAVANAWTARGFGLDMSVTQGMALMVLVGIFILIPAAPGYWGLYEAGVMFSLKYMNIGQNDSQRMAYALLLHLEQYIPLVIPGLYLAWRAQVKPGVVAAATGASELGTLNETVERQP